MNKNLIISLVAILIAIALIAVGVNYFLNDCTNCNIGQNQNLNVNSNTNTGLDNDTNQVDQMIVVAQPQENAEIASPLMVEGKARGNWFFEASFPISVYNSEDEKLATGIAQAKGEWMTEDFVDFDAQIEFANPGTGTGYLLLQRDNPSGLPENDAVLKIPIKFVPNPENFTVKVFFGNDEFNPNAMDCSLVYPLEREIPQTQAIARAAVEKLLEGPTEDEKADGYYTSINSGVKINSISIEDKTAYIDFDSQLEQGVGGSCRVLAIASQIKVTLDQFDTVDDVVISIDGRTEDILQP
ncbi:hypothetical protein C4566_02420 [Candidatus Parcubacteria bacterium]|nr:MAG: hypothetical protein C4566_02420 [Candidatus Parcubacteria bacterium]